MKVWGATLAQRGQNPYKHAGTYCQASHPCEGSCPKAEKCIRDAWREERQLRLSWGGGYKASEMHVPAFGLLKGAALHAWGSVVAFLLRLRQARWERCYAEVLQAVFA